MRIVIPIKPKAQARPRFTMTYSKRLGRHAGRAYKSKAQRQYDDALVLWLKAYCRRHEIKPLFNPFVLGVKVFVSPPKSWSKKKREAALRGNVGQSSKPDLSNYIKTIEDCGNGILWGDDSQVVRYTDETGKYYGLPERWEIKIIENWNGSAEMRRLCMGCRNEIFRNFYR
jgi:Holliday junction resolvase RusA-like endonuclease